MTEFTTGPTYGNSIHSTSGLVYTSSNLLGASDGLYATAYDHPTTWPWQINVSYAALNIPADATIIGAEVQVRGYLGAGSSFKSILVGMNDSGYITQTFSTTLTTVTYGSLTSWPAGWTKPAPSGFDTLKLTLAPAGFYNDNRSVNFDWMSIRVKYSTPNQSISPQTVVAKFTIPAQSATKADPSDPVGYTNEFHGGDVIRKSAVQRLRFGSDIANIAKGQVNISPDFTGAKIWAGTSWRGLVQPDAFLLGGIDTAKSINAASWTTVKAFQLDGAESSWGFSWILVGLTSGANARMRLNGDDTKVWDLTNHQTFAHFMSQNVYGIGRLSNTVGDQIINDAGFTMPSAPTLLEFQMRRVDATTANQVTSLSVWAHPR